MDSKHLFSIKIIVYDVADLIQVLAQSLPLNKLILPENFLHENFL